MRSLTIEDCFFQIFPFVLFDFKVLKFFLLMFFSIGKKRKKKVNSNFFKLKRNLKQKKLFFALKFSFGHLSGDLRILLNTKNVKH